MSGKKILEQRSYPNGNSFNKEIDFLFNNQSPVFDQEDVAEDIVFNIEQYFDGNEIPLEYGGHVIGSLKLSKDKGQTSKGRVEVSKPVMDLLLRRAFLYEEQQRESKAKELLVSLLLNHESNQTSPTLNVLGRILGYSLKDFQVVLIIEFEKKEMFIEKPSDWNKLRSVAIRIIESFLKFSGGYIVVSYYPGRIVVLKNIILEDIPHDSLLTGKNEVREKGESPSRQRKQMVSLAESLRQAVLLGTKHDIFIGVGECYQGVQAARQSYQEAFLALSIGKYMKEIKRSHICHIYDFALESLLTRLDETEKDRFIDRYLGSIKDEKELQETLEAFFQNNLNTAQAAEKAFLHRNTFTYRLDKIQNITGLNPRSFYDAMVLAIALMMKQVDTSQPV